MGHSLKSVLTLAIDLLISYYHTNNKYRGYCMRHHWVVLFCIVFMMNCSQKNVPGPYGALPSHRQLLWHQMKYHAFIHFGPNTFTDFEWGHGREDPDVFNPTELDCRQWARVIQEAGMEGAILTAKHHDGFCLWPSRSFPRRAENSASSWVCMSLPGTATIPLTLPTNTIWFIKRCWRRC